MSDLYDENPIKRGLSLFLVNQKNYLACFIHRPEHFLCCTTKHHSRTAINDMDWAMEILKTISSSAPVMEIT